MVVDDTPLVLAMPTDSIEELFARIQLTGASHVQLLVPDGVAVLHDQDRVGQLRQLATDASITLELISSDPQTLAAAAAGNLATLAVSGAQVVAPAKLPTPPPARPSAAAVTRPLARESEPTTTAPTTSAEADALAAMDAMRPADMVPPVTAGRSADATPPMADEDEELFAALQSLSETVEESQAPAASAAEATRPVAPEPPPRRVSAADIELDDAERRRAAQMDQRIGTRPVPRPAPLPPEPAATVGLPPEATGRRSSRTWPILVGLALVLIVLLIAIAGVLLVLGRSVTITVMPPVADSEATPIEGLPIPIGPPDVETGGVAVAAEPISSDVAFSVGGDVEGSTQAPSGTAGGVVTIWSLNQQPITIPAGTEFLAVTSGGSEVPFVSTTDVVVPPASTTDQGAQIVTTRGQAAVTVIARSPGSGSNVGANSIQRMAFPNGTVFRVDSGTLQVVHDPLSGGSEEEVRIVKESDVQQVIGEALAGLDNQARAQLAGLAAARGLEIEPTTLTPRQAELEQLQGFDYSVSPAIGETLDPNNPRFTLTVQARYSALATAPTRPLENQIGAALTEQLRQAGLIRPGDCRAPAITDWHWDGSALTIDGTIGPNQFDPSCTSLSPATLSAVTDAVRGRSRSEAELALNQMIEAGLISAYRLPEVEQMPGWDWQITVVNGQTAP
jgi:hypothetical protein